MDRRYQVFVSSTFLDLQEERGAVVSALLELDAIPAGMELFPAADDEAWRLIERVITASDYYVLVVGGRYGSVDPDTQVSFTEKEYDYAVAQGKPVLAFLHKKPDDLPLSKSEKNETTRTKLAAFRAKVETAKHVKYWAGSDDLAGKVSRSFAQARQTYPTVGWVRGDIQTSTESLSEINQLRKQVAALESQLASVRSDPPPGTDRLAQGKEPLEFSMPYEIDVLAAEHWGTWTGDHQEDVTWDEAFSGIGPYLLDEADQDWLYTQLTNWLTERCGPTVQRKLEVHLRAESEEFDDIRLKKVVLPRDDFNTVLVQLKALGLITRSERKRSLADKGTYWTMTPYGEGHLTTLRAISRNRTSES